VAAGAAAAGRRPAAESFTIRRAGVADQPAQIRALLYFDETVTRGFIPGAYFLEFVLRREAPAGIVFYTPTTCRGGKR